MVKFFAAREKINLLSSIGTICMLMAVLIVNRLNAILTKNGL